MGKKNKLKGRVVNQEEDKKPAPQFMMVPESGVKAAPIKEEVKEEAPKSPRGAQQECEKRYFKLFSDFDK